MSPAELHESRSDDFLTQVLRDKSPAQRLAMAHGMWLHARRLIQSVLRTEHPDWSTDEIWRETARRLSHESD